VYYAWFQLWRAGMNHLTPQPHWIGGLALIGAFASIFLIESRFPKLKKSRTWTYSVVTCAAVALFLRNLMHDPGGLGTALAGVWLGFALWALLGSIRRLKRAEDR
jgi:hypothetical protein